MRVAMHADFSVYSGYGNDAVDLALAMEGKGVDVLPLPRTLVPGLPQKFTRLLQKDPLARRPDVALVFMDPGGMSRKSMRPLADTVVLYTMWERTPFDADELGEGESDLTWADDLVVTCPMNVEAFRSVYPDREIGVVPAGVYPEKWDGPRRNPHEGPVKFLMAGVLSERKNPFALLETWRDLKRSHPEFDAELLVHSMGRNLHPGIAQAYGPDVRLSSKRLTPEQVSTLYRSVDVLVTTSRGEGNNKPAMEFMASGGPVVATDWSGHQNFMHRDVGWLLGGELQPVSPSRPDESWFEVDRSELASTLLHVAASPGEIVVKGRAARRHIASFGWDAAAERLIARMERAHGRH